MTSLDGLEGRDVVVTEKMDGENTTLLRDRLHARSLDWDSHPSRTMVRALHAKIAHDIPEGWRLCGENMQAVHSIRYNNLPGVFLLFSVWNEHNQCLPWDETKDWARLLDLHTVPMMYRGPWNEEYIRSLHQNDRNGNPCEGYVVRATEGFPYTEFRRKVAKYVRANHVQTDEHWKHRPVELNGFAKQKLHVKPRTKFRRRHPTFFRATKPTIPIARHPTIHTIAHHSRNHPKSKRQRPRKSKPSRKHQRRVTVRIHGTVFNQNNRIGIPRWNRNSVFSQQVLSPLALKRRKTKIRFCITADDKFYRSTTKIADTIKKNHRVGMGMV
jgi:hypothetical protein